MFFYTSSYLLILFISLRLQSTLQSLEISQAAYINQSLDLSSPTVLFFSLSLLGLSLSSDIKY